MWVYNAVFSIYNSHFKLRTFRIVRNKAAEKAKHQHQQSGGQSPTPLQQVGSPTGLMGASSPPTPGSAQTVGGYNISSLLGMQQVQPTGAALTPTTDSNLNKRKHEEGRMGFLSSLFGVLWIIS